MKWTAREIARSLHLHVFRGRHLVVVPDCQWTGHEADLLVVRKDLRLVDVEIKVTRADLKADAGKDKWIEHPPGFWWYGQPRPPGTPRAHPPRIWKHYYALPREIWKDELAADIQPASGVLLIRDRETYPLLSVWRQAKPNREAKAVSAEDVVDIARLASNRMWDAFDEVDSFRRQRAAVSTSGSAP